MAETETGFVDEFKPRKIPLKSCFAKSQNTSYSTESSNFSPRLEYAQIRENLNAAKTEKDNFKKLHLISHAISDINNHIEEGLWNVQKERVSDHSNTIRTLPILAGSQIECISTIQPAAWIAGFPGGLYNPIKDRIERNSVGHWQGRSDSLGGFLFKSVTSPCFIAYHIIAICALALSFVLTYTNKTTSGQNFRTAPIAIIGGCAIGYDVLAILAILILESFFPEDPKPFEATAVQKSVNEVVEQNLNELISGIPEETLHMWSDDKGTTATMYAGYYILNEFYEPALTLMNNGLLRLGGGLFSERKAPANSWESFEEFLNLYRFIREISDCEIEGYEQFEKKKNVVKAIVAGIRYGSEEVHIQLLRLIDLSMEKPEEREAEVIRDGNILNMYHYIGAEMTMEVIKQLKAPGKNISKENQLRIECVINKEVNEELVSYRTHASRIGTSIETA